MNIGDIGRLQDQNDLENEKKKVDNLIKVVSNNNTKIKDLEEKISYYKNEIDYLKAETMKLNSENQIQKGKILIFSYKIKYLQIFLHDIIEAGRVLSHPVITDEQKEFESVVSKLEEETLWDE